MFKRLLRAPLKKALRIYRRILDLVCTDGDYSVCPAAQCVSQAEKTIINISFWEHNG